MCDLETACLFGLVGGGARTTARIHAIPAVVQHLLCSRSDRCHPKIQRRYGYPRRGGAPKGTTDVDGTGAGYGLRSSCGMWGMLYVDDACIVSRSPQGLAKMMEVIVKICRAFA